ncbi:hypothetical protein M231_07188 [Tremella mesenterica]|uniref:Uncharacterized protein n=1 Tax=Tremella mesenterica TaxID=5217 RepID=A0A4Q1BCQ5_TREME|nr:uncharacterized protein TREMEDRAFT_63608 [Tremella mesenterica DSM 1558]EIW68441.1 hypothetical protein TREMEDRAFT_63608 [Tremella mesenterica DSM 1558]RXK35556.1 hypothetical protein M231_07188 [Tremella mesenterica]
MENIEENIDEEAWWQRLMARLEPSEEQNLAEQQGGINSACSQLQDTHIQKDARHNYDLPPRPWTPTTSTAPSGYGEFDGQGQDYLFADLTHTQLANGTASLSHPLSPTEQIPIAEPSFPFWPGPSLMPSQQSPQIQPHFINQAETYGMQHLENEVRHDLNPLQTSNTLVNYQSLPQADLGASNQGTLWGHLLPPEATPLPQCAAPQLSLVEAGIPPPFGNNIITTTHSSTHPYPTQNSFVDELAVIAQRSQLLALLGMDTSMNISRQKLTWYLTYADEKYNFLSAVPRGPDPRWVRESLSECNSVCPALDSLFDFQQLHTDKSVRSGTKNFLTEALKALYRGGFQERGIFWKIWGALTRAGIERGRFVPRTQLTMGEYQTVENAVATLKTTAAIQFGQSEVDIALSRSFIRQE